MVKVLEDRNVLVEQRRDLIRVSPHFYNTEEEIDQFIDHLETLIHRPV